jgi:hypothetical protein
VWEDQKMEIYSFLGGIGYWIGSLIFLGFVGIIGIISLISLILLLFFPGSFSSSGRSVIFYKRVLLIGITGAILYLSTGGVYHWYLDNMSRFFFIWLGWIAITAVFTNFLFPFRNLIQKG